MGYPYPIQKEIRTNRIYKEGSSQIQWVSFRFSFIKKNWAIEVSPGGLPDIFELYYLKISIPPSAQDRLYEVDTLKEAWSILEKIYGRVSTLEIDLSKNFWESTFLPKLLL